MVAVLGLLACGPGIPPDAVANAFTKKFPTAKKVRWDRENDTEWEAEFVIGKKEMSANFDLSGGWLETEGEIKEADIPANVLTVIKSEFPGFEIEEALTLDNIDFSGYEILVESKTSEFEVMISREGELISKTAPAEEGVKGEKREMGEKKEKG